MSDLKFSLAMVTDLTNFILVQLIGGSSLHFYQAAHHSSQMKSEYDLSKLKARKNPYASKLSKPVTLGLSEGEN